MFNSEDSLHFKKIDKICNIYHNHIRTEKNDNVYTSSITYDDGTMYLKNNLEKNTKLSWKEKTNEYKMISNEMKENEFTNLKHIIKNNDIINAPFFAKNIQKIDEIVFYYPYQTWPFGHYIIYGYRYFYYYVHLKQKYPNIKIIMNDPLQNFLNYGTTNNKWWFFLKKILELDNIIYTNNRTMIINSGTTFCVYMQMDDVCNLTDDCINFYNNIGQTSLFKNKIDTTLKLYPKKLLFLRKKDNISSNSIRLLENREEIVNFCKKYDYIDIDQTTYSMEEVIYLMNNATHLITETGGGLCHLLWTKSIKTISITWGYEPPCLLPNFYKKSNEYFKLIPPGSGKIFEKLLKNKNAKVIHNIQDKKLIDILEGKQNFLNPVEIPEKCIFLNFEDLEIAIKENE